MSSFSVLLTYALLDSELCETMQKMALAPSVATTENGEYFLMAIAEKKSFGDVRESDYIVVPIINLEDGVDADAIIF